MYLFSQRTITRSYQLDISFNTLSLIYMMLSSPSSGMGILPTTDQRRAPLRPGLANTERSRADHLPTNRASPLSWGVLPVGCSFGDSHENHRALTEAKRISKKDERKTSAGQSFRGKVGHWIATPVHLCGNDQRKERALIKSITSEIFFYNLLCMTASDNVCYLLPCTE